MTNKNTTKRALLSSTIALFLCFVMLIGTTFAWFTDEVSNTGNKITAGTLDVDLYHHNDNSGVGTEITNSSAPLFGEGSIAQNDASETLWEPGKTQTVFLSIKNNGSLDLKYQVAIVVSNITKNMNDVVSYIITPDAKYGDDLTLDWNNGVRVNSGINVDAEDVALTAGAEHFFALSVHMDELAGNEYQGGSITFDIKVLAAQLASEFDSFDNQYDADATYPTVGTGILAAGTAPEFGRYEIKVVNNTNNNSAYAGTVVLKEESVADTTQDVVITISETADDSRITVQANESVKTYDITATNLVAGNTEEIEVWLYVGTDLNVQKLYHNDTEISFTYDSTTGNVRFKTTSFSPFTVVLSSDPVEAPVAGRPTATITDITNNAPAGAYNWAFGGMDFQNAGIIYTLTPADLPELDVLYSFVADQTPEEAAASEYANWLCDYYVMVDQDIAANTIALGGYYEAFDAWLAFTNLQAVPANEWIPLLGLVSGGWTYQDIVSGVGTFLCGVADYSGTLGDTNVKFTVQLRLTNPDDADESIVCAEISYTFPKVVNSADELQDAVNNGNTNIELGGDIDLNDWANGFN